MAQILLLAKHLQDANSVDILPALGLLSHQIRMIPSDASQLTELPSAELIMLDARTDLVNARAMCKLLSGTNQAPILVIMTDGGLATVAGDWGFDDFVMTNIGPAELEARIRLCLSSSHAEEVISSGGIEIDESAYAARLNGNSLDLTYTEFELLKYLVQHPGRVFSREQLLSDVWGYDYYGGTRTVDVHVRRLRAKLGPEYEQMIVTVRNVGYRLAAR
ncbi:response regulator transcription factor [Naumannella halotolerans]|uniref:DNA-binding response OmpR family regulator n=1 Tax=Naumannella halotolerans TaxID=993414 RepID=A0A4R7J154_9ACTN|nr:response regulator transcription factor [Naumannella halotolerans]TDT30013.1 DNA-binding response OmpR family regulator [Naumannella halotolerans]